MPVADLSIRQIAALPYRIADDGALSILLITSRDTGRWVIPKGNVMPGIDDPEAAAQEAYEEAGVVGAIRSYPIGVYGYDKRRADGSVRRAEVRVFPLAVAGQLDDFPEKHERTSRWFPLTAAAAAVDEPELKAIITSLDRASTLPQPL